MPTECLIDTLKNHIQALDIIHDLEARLIHQKFQAIQHFIARHIIVLMDKRSNFDDGKYEDLVTDLKALYQVISVYNTHQSKLVPKESSMRDGIMHFIFPGNSYQPLLEQQDEEAVQASFHSDKIKQAIEERLPKLSRITMFKHFFKRHTLSELQAQAFADCLIQDQANKGVEL